MKTGAVSYPTTKKRFEAEDALLSGTAGMSSLALHSRQYAWLLTRSNQPSRDAVTVSVNEPCTKVGDHKPDLNLEALHSLRLVVLTYIPRNEIVSPGSEIAFHNVSGTGSLEWYSLQYLVSDPEAGQAQIRVNDELYATNMSELNSRAGYHHVVPIQLRLEPGDVNTIRVGAIGAKGMLHLLYLYSFSPECCMIVC